MVVVRLWVVFRVWAALSIWAAVMAVVDVVVLLACFVVRQEDIRRVAMAMIAMWVGCVLYMALKCFKWCFSFLVVQKWYVVGTNIAYFLIPKKWL